MTLLADSSDARACFFFFFLVYRCLANVRRHFCPVQQPLASSARDSARFRRSPLTIYLSLIIRPLTLQMGVTTCARGMLSGNFASRPQQDTASLRLATITRELHLDEIFKQPHWRKSAKPSLWLSVFRRANCIIFQWKSRVRPTERSKKCRNLAGKIEVVDSSCTTVKSSPIPFELLRLISFFIA